MSINSTLGKFIHFGRSNTFNPFSNSKDLKLLNERCFNIASKSSFANTNAICVPTGLVSDGNSFLSSDFIAEIIETNGTRLAYLIPKLATVGANIYPSEFDILWFDVEGIQSDYWVNTKWAGKVLRLSGKFETSAIIVDEMNNIHTNVDSIPNTIKLNPPPIGATYTQWNINAIAPHIKWAGTTWSAVATKQVFIKMSTYIYAVNNNTHWFDNNTTSIECDCIGGGGTSCGGSNANQSRNGNNSMINYNGSVFTATAGETTSSTTITGNGGRGYGKPATNSGSGSGLGSNGYGTLPNGGSGAGMAGSTTVNTQITGKSYIPLSPIKISINSSARSLIYSVGEGGIFGDGGGTKPTGNGQSGCVVIKEFSTETVYVRTA